MDRGRKWKLVWRWSLLTSALIALFWGIWYLANGSVPAHTVQFPLTNDLTVAFLYPVSRWWDVTIGPLWTTALILLVTSKKMSDKQIPSTFGVGLLFGWLVSLAFIVVPSLAGAASGAPELIALIVACLALPLGLVAALFKGTPTLWGVLGAALANGAVFGLAHGILLGASSVLLVLVCGSISALLGAGIRKIFLTLASKATWQAVGRWLTAK